eukprot:XP_022281035.1 kelch-like protein 3 isoform X5 [Canis lupus familiaris]
MEGESIKLSSQPPVQAGDDEKNQRTITVNSAHMGKAFKVMNELRSKQLLCDVMIVAEDVEIEAHRVVLAACSPYFCAMFTGDMSESKAKKIEIKDVDGRTLNKLIDYIYTAEIEVTEENVQFHLIYCEADTSPVTRTPISLIQNPTSFTRIKAFGRLHWCCYRQPACCSSWMFGRTAVTFCSLSCIPPIAWASAHLQMCTPAPTFFSRPMLMQVFEAVISWINYEKETRLEHMAKLMEHVRLPLLPRDYLVQVMIVVGGQAPKAIRSVECYDFEEDRWDQIAELPSRRCRAGVVFMAGHVYAVGGFNGSLRVRTVDVYDGVKDQWTSIASMQERRSTLGAAVLNDLLYAVGGFDGSTGLASVEAYSYKTNEWFFVAPMNTRRSSVGVGVVEGKLYAVGGYDGASRQCLSTVEQYNPATNEWTYVADMSTRRSGAGVGVLSGQLYATGGHDGPLVRKSVEVYDPGTNTWKQVADMNMCRRNAGVCAVNGLLYVVGGDDGSCNLASVEYYNPVTDKWTLLPTNMSTGRSYAGVAVIHKPL